MNSFFVALVVVVVVVFGGRSVAGADLKCGAPGQETACDLKKNLLMCQAKDPTKADSSTNICATVNQCLKDCKEAKGKYACACCQSNAKGTDCLKTWQGVLKGSVAKVECAKGTVPQTCQGFKSYGPQCGVKMENNKTQMFCCNSKACDAMKGKDGCVCMKKECNVNMQTCKGADMPTTAMPNSTTKGGSTTKGASTTGVPTGKTSAKKTTAKYKTTTTTTMSEKELSPLSGAGDLANNVGFVVGMVALSLVV